MDLDISNDTRDLLSKDKILINSFMDRYNLSPFDYIIDLCFAYEQARLEDVDFTVNYFNNYFKECKQKP